MVLRSVGQAVVLLATLGKSRHWLWERWFRPFLLLSKGHKPRGGAGVSPSWLRPPTKVAESGAFPEGVCGPCQYLGWKSVRKG